jgi:predicted Zn-dependent protease
MSTKRQIDSILNLIKKNCDADDYIVRIGFHEGLETRFAQNRVTQHIAGKNSNISIQVAYGSQWGSARINQTDQESILNAIKKAKTIATLSEMDPEFMPSAPAAKYHEFQNYYTSTAKLKVLNHIEIISQCIKNAKEKDAFISGMTEHHLSERYLFTKNGFAGKSTDSRFEHSMTMKKDDRETKVSKSVLDFHDFNLKAEIDQLNAQFDSLTSPSSMEPGKYNVILRPNAVVELFLFMLYGFDRRDSDDGLSPFTDKIGKEIFGKMFTLTSDTKIKGLFTPGYSNEGIPTSEIAWVKNGILENMPVSRYYAKLKKLKHVPDLYNVHIHGGKASESEMMKKAGNGIIVNRFWYIRNIDRKTGELTGMTRDGVLYFEKGKVVKAVNNFRFNEIPHEVTKRILALGESILQDTETKIPTMLIKDFNFVDKTSF